ncbi:MAG: hypothetical protein LUQ38_09220 [Methanotrichaceae archaeon]|nr:hypothetical protein [Methanotrichaceae archaeon]
MSINANTEFVQGIMLDFARLSGLAPVDAQPRRYLWTDAFALINYLELFSQTNNVTYLDLGLSLIGQVHHILGRHRDDDPRRGWISGLNELDGEQHPAIGGLRIGKQLKERKLDEPRNEHLEWDQDGQYYHYLTKWMHALNCASQVAGDPIYTKWAIELAEAAHASFTYTPPSGGRRRMYWKMSIDLTYPLVPSMGQHDPLDGFVTYEELQATATEFFGAMSPLNLKPEIADMAEICRGIRLATDDPLGIGGLLFDASRIRQLMAAGFLENAGLLEAVMEAALLGMDAFVKGNSLDYPVNYRLAFRELGLSIGLSEVENLHNWIKENALSFSQGKSLQRLARDLTDYLPLREKIEKFWMDDKNRKSDTWIEHREINIVMLATSLAPKRFMAI